MVNKKKTSRKSSKTRSFGVPKRESHDSSHFYNSNVYSGLVKPITADYIDNSKKIPSKVLDHIVLGDSRDLSIIPDNSIHLVVTSPPYNVTKDYDDNLTLKEYLSLRLREREYGKEKYSIYFCDRLNFYFSYS